MALGTERTEAAEHRWRVDRNRHAVRNDRRGWIPRWGERADPTGDGIGHRMRRVHTRVPERDAGKRCGPHDLRACFGIRLIAHRTHEERARESKRLATTEVTPRVRALAHRS